MGLFGSKHQADLFKGQYHIHRVIATVLDVAIARATEFADADQAQLNLKNCKGQAVATNYSDLLNYIHHVWIIIEEHHWHEENLIFNVVKEKAPEAVQAIEGFEKEHVQLVDLLHQLDTRIHEKDIKAVGPHAREVTSLLTQIKALVLPHFEGEERSLSREQYSTALTAAEQNDIESKILKHVQASAQSNVRLAIMYYSQSDADRNSMFAAVPSFVTKNSFPDEDTGSVYSSELTGSPLGSDEFNSSDVFQDDEMIDNDRGLAPQQPSQSGFDHVTAPLMTPAEAYTPQYQQYITTVPDPNQYSAQSHVTGTQIDQHAQGSGNFIEQPSRPFTVLANTWPEFTNNSPFKSPLPWSITCSGVPEKSRVETQIRLRLGLTHESGQNAWPLLKIDAKAISPTHVTKKISKDKKEEQQSLAEREQREEHVIMETRVVSAGTNVAEALSRASSASEVNHVLETHSIWSCYGCIQRERKNVQRKIKGQNNIDVTSIDRHSILQFYCDQYFDLNQLRGEFVTPLRVTCYCRHHKELEGFSILVLLFNSTTRALVGTCQTEAVMITDDHKSAVNPGTVPATPHVTNNTNVLGEVFKASPVHSRDSSSDEPDFGPNRKRRRVDSHSSAGTRSPSQIVPPQLDRLIPTQGPLSGGLEVTLLGANFQPGMQVRFGSQVTHTSYWGPQTLICICPPYHQPATVPVKVFASHEGAEVSSNEHVFTYIDDGDRRLLELALQIIGMKYHGQVSDPKSVALDIINNQHTFTSTQYSNTNVNYRTQSDTVIEMTRVNKIERLVLAAVKHALEQLDTLQLEDGTSLLSLRHRKTGATLLHYAAIKQYHKLFNYLLSEHCVGVVDVNAQDKNGSTTLHHTTRLQLKDMCQALIEHRANTQVVDEHGDKPLDLVTSAHIAAVFRSGRSAPAEKRVQSVSDVVVYDEELGDESTRLVQHSPVRMRAGPGPKSRAPQRGFSPARWALYVVGVVFMSAVVIYSAAPSADVTPPGPAPQPVPPPPPSTLLPPGTPLAPVPPTPTAHDTALDWWSLLIRLGGFIGLMMVFGLVLQHVHTEYLSPQLNGSGRRMVYWTGAVSLVLATLIGLIVLALL